MHVILDLLWLSLAPKVLRFSGYF